MASNEYAQQVATTLIEQLKQGTAPWVRPWQPGERWLPYNPTTSNNYQGMNALWLDAIGCMKEYRDARWLTYKQAQAEEAQVQKGEKGTVIQYWKWEGLEPLKDEQGKPVLDENGQPKRQMVRYQRPRVISALVFNAAQIDGLSPPPDRPGLPEWERHEMAEAILSASGAAIGYAPGNRAFYNLTSDQITLPERGQFPQMDGFYATALHELGHWTGHPTRLDRDLAHPFGSEGYAKEELRAEIASMMLGEQLSLGHDPGQHAAYVGSWIHALEEDPREIFRAAADAEKIVRFIRGLEKQQVQTLESALPSMIQVPVLVEEVRAMSTVPDRIYLEVPFAEKDEAKKLGARWDRQLGKWYAQSGVDLAPLQRWMTGQAAQVIEHRRDPIEEFSLALREAGLLLEGLPAMDGQLHRVPVDGDARGERSGAYVGFLDGHPAGYINNFKLGLETNWKSANRTESLTAKDHERLLAEVAQKRQERSEAKEADQRTAALVAEALLAVSQPARSHHPYLTHKGVEAHGLRETAEGHLLIPMQDLEGKVWSTQTINEFGRKSFQPEGRLLGLYFMIGELKAADPILIAEGFATGATVHEATGLPVAIAFVSGNLAPVAEAFWERYPEKPIILVADNDHVKAQEGKPNVGKEKAEEAAQRVGGHVLLPQFTTSDLGTDWNDLAKSQGLATVQKQLQDGLAKALRQHNRQQKTFAIKNVISPERTFRQKTQEIYSGQRIDF